MIISADDFATAEVAYESQDGFALFEVQTSDPEVTETVRVRIDDAGLHFFPERSSAHKRVLALLNRDAG